MTAAIKKTDAIDLIRHGEKGKRDAIYPLLIADHAGRRWASNTYWWAPAEWFQLVCPGQEPGSYDAKTGEDTGMGAPSLERIWPTDAGDLLEPIRTIGDRQALVKLSGGAVARLYRRPDGEPVALNDRYVSMFEAMTPALVIRQDGGHLRPVQMFAESFASHVSGEKTAFETTTGILMPIRLD